ncbi:MAG: hypothetical protein WCB49_01095 [Gammaproteobacteria bacterium]
MILSRVIEHMRHQHWTAVFLDLVVVVLGVFIGTNVTNWNDAHKTKMKSHVYSQRLLKDLYIEYQHDLSLLDYQTTAKKAALATFIGLTRPGTMGDRKLLINAFRATQYEWFEQHRAAYDELLSSGELDLISKPQLRETAVVYYGNSATTFQLMQDDVRASQYRALFFQLVDPAVEMALRRDCGDREYTTSGGVSGAFTISYDCQLSVDDGAVKKAVAALRNDPRILPALRYQSAVADTETANLTILLDQTGLKALFDKAPAH